MNTQGPRLLVCTNGTAESQEPLAYSLLLAQSLDLPVTLLGIQEKAAEAAALQKLLSTWTEKFAAAGRSVDVSTVSGRAEEVISAQAAAQEAVVVFGRMGRPLLQQWLAGKSFRHILGAVASPLLYVPYSVWPVRRILICTGGLDYATTLETFSIWLAARLEAEVTLLHVVEPTQLDYPLARETSEHWQDLEQTDTPQGRSLKAGLLEARNSGLSAQIKLRRGHAVREILQEVRGGQYDLVGLGSQHSSDSLRHLYLPNVTAEVAEQVDIPVLAVRFGSIISPG